MGECCTSPLNYMSGHIIIFSTWSLLCIAQCLCKSTNLEAMMVYQLKWSAYKPNYDSPKACTGIFSSTEVCSKSIENWQKDTNVMLAIQAKLYYNPMSLLPIFSKVLGRLGSNRQMKFLTKYDVLHRYKFGFRRKMEQCYTEYQSEQISLCCS